MSRRELVYLGIMIFLFLVTVVVIGGIQLSRTSRPSDVAAPPETRDPGMLDPADTGPGPEGGAPEKNGGGPAVQPPPIPAEFLQQMQAALQAVQDGDDALFGPAFDYTIDYCRRVSWDEINRQADPGLAPELHAGTGIEQLNPAALESYRDRWRKARGRFVEVHGILYKERSIDLPTKVGDLSTVHEVWIVQDGRSYLAYVLDFNAELNKEAVLKGVFYKYRRVEIAGNNTLDVPVLVAKAFGGGGAGAVELTQEEKILAQVRDLTHAWRGPALYHLLQKYLAADPGEVEEWVLPGLVEAVDVPKEHASMGPAELLEWKGPTWRDRRGGCLAATGTIKFLETAELPAGAVSGLETVHWGQIQEDETERRITFAVAEKPEFEEGDSVTIRGAFLKMWRYTTKGGEPHNSIFVVGRRLTTGVVHPVFTKDDYGLYIDAISDRNAKLHTDSFYYHLWWMDTQADRSEIVEKADPALGERLHIDQTTELDEKTIEKFHESWKASRDEPMRILGRLVYIHKEEIPRGRMPEGYPRTHVWNGAIFTKDYHLYTFTSLERGDVEPDGGVEIRGVFHKEWRYQNRRGEYSDTIHVLAHTIEPLKSNASEEWMMPFVVALAGVSLVILLGLVIAVASGRAEPRTRRRRARAEESAGDAPPTGETSLPQPETQVPAPSADGPGREGPGA